MNHTPTIFTTLKCWLEPNKDQIWASIALKGPTDGAYYWIRPQHASLYDIDIRVKPVDAAAGLFEAIAQYIPNQFTTDRFDASIIRIFQNAFCTPFAKIEGAELRVFPTETLSEQVINGKPMPERQKFRIEAAYFAETLLDAFADEMNQEREAESRESYGVERLSDLLRGI